MPQEAFRFHRVVRRHLLLLIYNLEAKARFELARGKPNRICSPAPSATRSFGHLTAAGIARYAATTGSCFGGGSEIRTHEKVAFLLGFRPSAFVHSAIPPYMFQASCLVVWHARRDSNPRPPGS
jgi:hypothetical protein